MGIFPLVLTLSQWAGLTTVLSLFTDQVKLYVPTHSSLTFLFFFNIYLFIWLHQVLIAACGIFSVHCSIQDVLVAACGIYFPGQGSNRGLLHYECRVLATGPPGKSQAWHFLMWVPSAHHIQSLGSKSMCRDSSHRSFAGHMGSIPGPRRCHKPQGDQAHVPHLLSAHATTRESLHTAVKTKVNK